MSYSAEAQEKREMAARARRRAGSHLAEADRRGLIRAARQLETEAQELEKQADGQAADDDSPPSRRRR